MVNFVEWSHWNTFLGVVRCGTLSEAARQLRLSQPTVGRQIAAIEQTLDQALFTRSRAGLAPTPVALALIPHAEAMLVAAEALQRVSSGAADEAAGTIRITASEIAGVEILPTVLSDFQAHYAGVAVELSLNNRNEDLLRRDADIALRMVRPTQEAIVTKRIGRIPVGLYVHRTYVERRGLPVEVASLFDHALIGPDRDERRMAGVEIGGRPLTRDILSFRVDDDVAQLAALRAGLGIGACQRRIAEQDRELIPVLEHEISFDLELWLAMHEDLRSVRRVRLLFDYLCHALVPWAM
jgi:DNA-binding transcriptional LysR family regulator